MVSRLQDEKRRILKQQQQSGSSSSESSPRHEISTSIGKPANAQHAAQLATMRTKAGVADDKDTADVQVMQRLRSQLEKNRNEMKLKDIDLQAKTADVDNVSVMFQ